MSYKYKDSTIINQVSFTDDIGDPILIDLIPVTKTNNDVSFVC